MSTWRVGRSLGRSLYIGDTFVGCMDTTALAASVVEAMNARAPVGGASALVRHCPVCPGYDQERRIVNDTWARCVSCRTVTRYTQPASDAPVGAAAEPKVSDEDNANAERWHYLALIHGYNELVKQAGSLHEKVYLRAARELAENDYKARGGELVIHREGEVLVLLRSRGPGLRFMDADIEAMRSAVAQHDAGRAASPPGAGETGKGES